MPPYPPSTRAFSSRISTVRPASPATCSAVSARLSGAQVGRRGVDQVADQRDATRRGLRRGAARPRASAPLTTVSRRPAACGRRRCGRSGRSSCPAARRRRPRRPRRRSRRAGPAPPTTDPARERRAAPAARRSASVVGTRHRGRRRRRPARPRRAERRDLRDLSGLTGRTQAGQRRGEAAVERPVDGLGAGRQPDIGVVVDEADHDRVDVKGCDFGAGKPEVRHMARC